MNILHMISGGDVGGAKTHVLNLLQTLTKSHRVLLVCFMEGEFAEDARRLGIDVAVMDSGSLTQNVRLLQKRITEEKFQVVHCHGAKANLTGALLRGKISAPVVTTVHSDPKIDYLGRPLARLTYGTLNAWALRHLRYWIGAAGPTCEMLVSRKFPKERVFEMRNGVDFSNPCCQQSREGFLQSLGMKIEENTVVFGIAARMNPVKDMKTLVRGFALAVGQAPEIRLVIAGDGEERSELEALVDDLGLKEKVFFAGWLRDVDSFYNAIDVNVLTSLSEGGFPYAITEGVRMGCAVISTNVGGVAQVLRHEENALLLEPGDAETLAKHMVRLTRDGGLRQRLQDTLYQLIKKEYSLEAMGNQQIEIYKKICAMEKA